MARFDFVDATAKAFEFTWRERSYVLLAAVPVILVKLLCAFMVIVLGWQEMSLLNGLVFMPAHVIEALFVIALIRYVLYAEPVALWGRPLHPPEPAQKPLLYSDPAVRGRSIQAGFAMYLLIKITQLALAGAMMDYTKVIEEANMQDNPPPPTVWGALVILSLLWFFVWSFRLLWLYIPTTMGYSWVEFLRRIKGFNSSLSFLAAWFLCYMPVIILFALLFGFADFLVGGVPVAEPFVRELLRASGDLFLTVLPVLAMTYGIVEILSRKVPPKR